MSNTWRATDYYGNEDTFLSRDFDAFDLAEKLNLPVTVVDQTDGDRPVGVIQQQDGVPTLIEATEHIATYPDSPVGPGLRFDPVHVTKLRRGDLVLVGTTPGFVTGIVVNVACVEGRYTPDVTVRFDNGRELRNPAFLDFKEGRALVLRSSGNWPVGDLRR